jgi:FlaA1/EpsC-like NDP-sugar epimerase
MEQIDRGGPVTVTHPEMKRFFMTIPEATLLIVQAGAFEEVGVVYILDMGEEVKIYDLARKLIRLRGYRIEDIKIEFIGPRKGERLTEVLHDPDEKLIDSPHPQIKKIYPKNLPEFEVLLQQIDQMKSIATLLLRDELIKFMKQILISCGVSIKTNFQNSMKTKLHS